MRALVDSSNGIMTSSWRELQKGVSRYDFIDAVEEWAESDDPAWQYSLQQNTPDASCAYIYDVVKKAATPFFVQENKPQHYKPHAAERLAALKRRGDARERWSGNRFQDVLGHVRVLSGRNVSLLGLVIEASRFEFALPETTVILQAWAIQARILELTKRCKAIRNNSILWT